SKDAQGFLCCVEFASSSLEPRLQEPAKGAAPQLPPLKVESVDGLEQRVGDSCGQDSVGGVHSDRDYPCLDIGPGLDVPAQALEDRIHALWSVNRGKVVELGQQDQAVTARGGGVVARPRH